MVLSNADVSGFVFGGLVLSIFLRLYSSLRKKILACTDYGNKMMVKCPRPSEYDLAVPIAPLSGQRKWKVRPPKMYPWHQNLTLIYIILHTSSALPYAPKKKDFQAYGPFSSVVEYLSRKLSLNFHFSCIARDPLFLHLTNLGVNYPSQIELKFHNISSLVAFLSQSRSPSDQPSRQPHTRSASQPATTFAMIILHPSNLI